MQRSLRLLNRNPKYYMEKINLLNQPKRTGHELDKGRDERVESLIPHLMDFVKKHPLFQGKDTNITFAEQGVSSLVSIIATPDDKFVLKISLAAKPIEGETMFLKKWKDEGVKVPTILEDGTIDESNYILMEFIDAKDLTKTFSYEEMLAKGIFKEMGGALAKMHRVKGDGYGRLIGGKAQFSTFDDFILDEKTKRKFSEVQTLGVLSEDQHGFIVEATNILRTFVQSNPQSSYCHNDFAPTNVFATTPITVFDPDPVFNHPYMDVGRSIVITAAHSGLPESAEQIISGYFEGLDYNAKALHASIIFNAHTKILNWHKKGKKQRVENIQRYLIQTKMNIN